MTKYKSLKSQTVQRTTKFHTMYLELIGQITWKPENIQNGPRMHIVGATPIWLATIASSKEPSNPWNRPDFGIHSTVPSLWIFTTNIYVCFHGTALYWCEVCSCPTSSLVQLQYSSETASVLRARQENLVCKKHPRVKMFKLALETLNK